MDDVLSYLLSTNVIQTSSTSITAAYNTWYQIKTDALPPGTVFNVYLPSGVLPGQRIIVQNMPVVTANGQNINIFAAAGEQIRLSTSEVLAPPASYPVNMAAHAFFSIGPMPNPFGFLGWIR